MPEMAQVENPAWPLIIRPRRLIPGASISHVFVNFPEPLLGVRPPWNDQLHLELNLLDVRRSRYVVPDFNLTEVSVAPNTAIMCCPSHRKLLCQVKSKINTSKTGYANVQR